MTIIQATKYAPVIPDTVMYEQVGEYAVQQYDIYTWTVPESWEWTVQTRLKSTSNWSSHLNVIVNWTLEYDFTKAWADGYSALLTHTFNWTSWDSVRLYAYHDLSWEVAYVEDTKIYKVNS